MKVYWGCINKYLCNLNDWKVMNKSSSARADLMGFAWLRLQVGLPRSLVRREISVPTLRAREIDDGHMAGGGTQLPNCTIEDEGSLHNCFRNRFLYPDNYFWIMVPVNPEISVRYTVYMSDGP